MKPKVRYVLSRIVGLLLTLFAVFTFTFALTFAVPQDPARSVVGPKGTPEQIEIVREELGLNDPIPVQYVRYLGNVATADLGYSYAQRRPVVEIISERLPFTAALAAGAILFQIGVGVPIGLLAAARAGKTFDRVSLAGSLMVIALPGFWVGLVLLFLLAYTWPIFPLGGTGSFLSIVLPSITLGLAGAAWTSRIMRSEAYEFLRSDVVRGLRAKGMSPRRILLVHTLRAASGPVLTMLAIDLGYFLGGAVLIESVFSWPGIGLTSFQALRQNDIPLLMGCVIVGSVFILVLNLLADLIRLKVDPRVTI
ncbi:ABC transporter permease [Lysobacter korlensis]|uniref:ABC transporter permease n=1 Tax=Lysobacter korlensis TaxID=553636 RepID=A0ABV6RT04_9GAMM